MGVASVSAYFATFLGSVGTILGTVIVALLAIFAGLLGLGFAIRHTKKWVTGRKA